MSCFIYLCSRRWLVVNTKAIYLSTLEAGLSLIAVNLPSLWFLRQKVSPESFLRSVRSMTSVRSDRSAASSQGKGDDQRQASWLDKKRSNSNSSRSGLAHPDAHFIQTHTMRDLEHEEHGPPKPVGNIQITDRISRSAEQV